MDQTTITAITTLLSGGSVTGIIAGVIILFIILIPFITKFSSWSKEQSANGTLYSQLAEQLKEQQQELKGQRAEIDKVILERNEFMQKVIELKGRIEHLENCEVNIEELKKKLDEKDDAIAERDTRISNLLRELLQMKDKLHNLELRMKNNSDLCYSCNQYLYKDNKGG